MEIFILFATVSVEYYETIKKPDEDDYIQSLLVKAVDHDSVGNVVSYHIVAGTFSTLEKAKEAAKSGHYTNPQILKNELDV